MLKNSAFRVTVTRKNTNKHRGYDYKGKILKNTMSASMFTGNELMYNFLMKIDGIVYELFDNIKSIRNFMSISRNIHDRDMN